MADFVTSAQRCTLDAFREGYMDFCATHNYPPADVGTDSVFSKAKQFRLSRHDEIGPHTDQFTRNREATIQELARRKMPRMYRILNGTMSSYFGNLKNSFATFVM